MGESGIENTQIGRRTKRVWSERARLSEEERDNHKLVGESGLGRM